MEAYLGEFAALITAVCWAGTSVFFALASERVGSQVVNRVRLLLATALLALVHWVWQGSLFPFAAAPERWGWLSLSAVIGLVIGDGLLFYAFTQIGARLAMLLMALAPVIGALLAWAFLGETLSLSEMAAVALTISGVAWVILERNAPRAAETRPRNYVLGVLGGIGAAAGQASGLVLSKQGMLGDFFPVSASLMRVTFAALAIWLLAAAQGEVRLTLAALRDRRIFAWILGGALVGPVLGMTLSLVAVQLSHVGIASTLMALSPIVMLPLGYGVFDERITFRAVAGTLVAMAGVGMIFLA